MAILYGCDLQFKMQLWNRLLPQVIITLNLLQSSCLNPRLSTYTQVQENFDFNRTP